MATKVFKIPTLVGLRWTKETFIPTPGYNSLPPDQEIDYTSYATPIQRDDTAFPVLICLSDYPDMLLQFFNSDTLAVIATPTLTATASSLIGQTFLQYLAVVDFAGFPTGWCFGRVSFDTNAPATIAGSLTESLSPFIDGNLILFLNGVETDLTTSGQTFNGQLAAGKSYTFVAQSIEAGSAANPRLRLTVKKNGVTIFDKSIVCDAGVTQITYSGIAQPGAAYTATVVTEDTAVVITPINISDSAAVIPTLESWITCPVDVQDEHSETMLFQYQNSENDNDVLWTPGDIILQMRVEANMVGGYQPKSNRESFEDQRFNPTLLNGIEYDMYTLYLLGAGGPDWIIRKLNHIFANCDQVKIDYEFYVATNGNEFKLTRPNGTWDREAMAEIDLQIVPGFTFGQLTAGTVPQGDLVVIRKVWPPLAVQAAIAGSFSIVGIFTVNSTIDYVQVFNFGFDEFIMKLGTSPGANDIGQLEIGTPNEDDSVDLMGVYDVGEPFNESVTVYVTVPDGVNIKCLFVYDQLDSPVLNPAMPVGAALPQGTVAFYKELAAGYFTRDWDIATGFGQAGSLYEGCQILDQGAGKVLQAWDRLNNDVANPGGSRGTPGIGGANEVGASVSAPITVSANAGIGAVAILVNALTQPIPSGAILKLKTGTGQTFVTLTAAASIGDTSLTVTALTSAVNTSAVYNAIGLVGGNEILIPRTALPNEGLSMFTSDVNDTNGDTPGPTDEVARAASDGRPLSYEARRGPTGNANVGVTGPMGAGASLSIQNDGLILLCYVKL